MITMNRIWNWTNYFLTQKMALSLVPVLAEGKAKKEKHEPFVTYTNIFILSIFFRCSEGDDRRYMASKKKKKRKDYK